jgi:radical SAM superfamily enzyme YgiQ (UPF0313 family)
MKVLFISANREKINILPLPVGLNSVAVATRAAGHEVQLLDLLTADDPEKAIRRSIESFAPQAIGISVRNIDNQDRCNPVFLLDQAKEAVDLCRKFSDATIFLGGAGFSIFPESVQDYLQVDLGIQGEGEIATALLLDRLESGRASDDVPGLYIRGRGCTTPRSYVRDLDTLLPVDPSFWPVPGESKLPFMVPVQTRRGCPLACSYCSTSTIEGCRIRRRSPENVIPSIAEHAEAGFKRFFFVDNTFNFPPSYAAEICRLIIESDLKISWSCIIYPRNVKRELVELMARAGCTDISLGFESGSSAVLQEMNKRFDAEEVRRISRLFGESGIRRLGFLMLGGPAETEQTVQQSYEFAEELDLEGMRIVTGIRIYPFTKLAQTAHDEGIIKPSDDLLQPAYYIKPELRELLEQATEQWKKAHPGWLF